MFTGDESQPLTFLRRRLIRVGIKNSFKNHSRSLQKFANPYRCVDLLYVNLLISAVEKSVPVLILRHKQSQHIFIGLRLRIVGILPDKASVLPAVRDGAVADACILRLRGHIEDKQPSGIQIVVDQPEHLKQIPVLQKVVETVTDTDHRPDSAVQFELPHILIEIEDIMSGLIFFLLGLFQHIHRTVDADDLITLTGQKLRHRSRAAAQFADQTVLDSVFLQNLCQISAPPFIIHVVHEQIIDPGKTLIFAHVSSF